MRSGLCWRAMFWCGVVVVMGGCGPAFEDFVGVYDGTLSRTERRNEQQFMTEVMDYAVYVSPSNGRSLSIQLRPGCAVRGTMLKDGVITISQTECDEERAGYTFDGVVTAGEGSVSEDGRLSLTVTIEGTRRIGELEPEAYEVTESFEGVRR